MKKILMTLFLATSVMSVEQANPLKKAITQIMQNGAGHFIKNNPYPKYPDVTLVQIAQEFKEQKHDKTTIPNLWNNQIVQSLFALKYSQNLWTLYSETLDTYVREFWRTLTGIKNDKENPHRNFLIDLCGNLEKAKIMREKCFYPIGLLIQNEKEIFDVLSELVDFIKEGNIKEGNIKEGNINESLFLVNMLSDFYNAVKILEYNEIDNIYIYNQITNEKPEGVFTIGTKSNLPYPQIMTLKQFCQRAQELNDYINA